MKPALLLLIVLLSCFLINAQTDTTQHWVKGRRNSIKQQKKPYVILISVDGLRYDYAEKFKAKNLLKLSGQGVKAAYMIPSFPSLTYPNHYTIATGLYPSHHGLVDNNFYDRKENETFKTSDKVEVKNAKWYGGTPLWVLAEQQQMVSASFYWVGTEAPVKGMHPSYYYYYNEKIPVNERIKVIANWLKLPKEKRPHFITVYFPEVDHAGHDFGPDAPETKNAVLIIDSAVQRLTQAVNATGLQVNFILVSDHGMTAVDTKNTLSLPAGVDTSQFRIPAEGNLVQMYARDAKDILPTYNILRQNENQYKVYLKSNTPERWHYGAKDDKMNRIGDILVVPDWPKVFDLRKHKINKGWHGYDPALVKEMNATFYAWGPAFKKGMKIPAFENVHIYPLITHILGLKITDRIDGRREVLEKVLRQQ